MCGCSIIGNAIKFTEAGAVQIQVTATDGVFTVAVADTGPGIAEADQQTIFEEFQQADSSITREKGGTGSRPIDCQAHRRDARGRI